MEAFSFLKNRRSIGDSDTPSVITPRFSNDGSYFDLQFTLPDVIHEEDEEEYEDEDDKVYDNEEELEDEEIILEDSSKFLVSLVKSASKLRLMLLKLRRSKSVSDKSDNGEEEEEEDDDDLEIEEKQGKANTTSKFFTAKFKVDDMKLRLVSLFTTSKDGVKLQNDDTTTRDDDVESGSSSGSGEGKMTKEMLQKYLKMVKPLYFLVTKNNYVGRLKLSGNVGFPRGGGGGGGGVVSPPAEKMVKRYEKQGSSNNLVAKLKVVGKHLGKSQPGDTVAPPQKVVAPGRCDDSMLEVQDGIQGAILHCKKSLNASISTGNEPTSTSC